MTKKQVPASAITSIQKWVLALASLGSFMVILDMMVVSTALTAIQRNLGSSLEGLEWTLNAYTLSFAVLLMTAATLGDRFGRRRMFAAGLALFAVSSAICALSPSVGVLIAARVIQGVGAATIMPMALALLNGAFPPDRRGWALGIFGSVTGLGAVLGPIVGGLLTRGLGWPWIFWINVPIALLMIPLLYVKVQETSRTRQRVDLLGLTLITVVALGLVWGLIRANSVGWVSAEVLGALIVGIIAAAAFVMWEHNRRATMLPLRLFRNRAFSAGNTAIFFLNAGLTGAIFFMAQFQQIVLEQDPLNAGLRLLPWGIAPFVLAPFAGSLADRLGSRPLAVVGLLLQAVGSAWIALTATTQIDYANLIAPMSVLGIGFALAIPSLTRAATSEMEPSDIGKASGAYSTMRQLGGAFGIAILGAVFASYGSYSSQAAFTSGFSAALYAGAILALAGAGAATLLAGKRTRATVRSSPSQNSAGLIEAGTTPPVRP
ncbi:efflux MFS transporter permease [Humibacter ginsengisoli]